MSSRQSRMEMRRRRRSWMKSEETSMMTIKKMERERSLVVGKRRIIWKR